MCSNNFRLKIVKKLEKSVTKAFEKILRRRSIGKEFLKLQGYSGEKKSPYLSLKKRDRFYKFLYLVFS